MPVETPAVPVAVAPPRAGWLRRNRAPLAPLVPLVGLWAALRVMNKFEIGLEFLMAVMMAFQFAVMLSVLFWAGWFLFASGFAARTKAAVAGFVVLAIGGLVAAIGTFEFDGQMSPKVRWRWEPTAEQLLETHLAAAPAPVGAADVTVGSTDSPYFRGPAGDGVTPGVTLADWAKTPPKELWKHPVGGGHAGVAVAGNAAVTLEQRGPNEVVVGYDRTTGNRRWEFAYPAEFTHTQPMGGGGPRTTPAIADGAVFTLGATGELVCLDGASGAKRWQVNVLANNGAKNLEWAMSGSPLVVGKLVVVNPGIDPDSNAGKAVAAYDRATGAKVWAAGTHMAGYASPVLAKLGGTEQVVIFDADGLGGYDPAAGTELWRHPWKSPMGMNSAQPVVVGADRVFISSEKGNGCAVVEVKLADGKWTTREVWKTLALAARYTTPVVVGGHAYGLTDGQMACIDLATGKRQWRDGNFGTGQILRAGDKLVVTAESGRVVLVAPDPTELKELGEVGVFKDRTWNMPALAGNQLFVRNHREMGVLELPKP